MRLNIHVYIPIGQAVSRESGVRVPSLTVLTFNNIWGAGSKSKLLNSPPMGGRGTGNALPVDWTKRPVSLQQGEGACLQSPLKCCDCSVISWRTRVSLSVRGGALSLPLQPFFFLALWEY